VQRKFDPRTLKNLILEHYSGPILDEKAGIKIRCPWHQPDNNPSCMVFVPSGTFYCVVCHGDKEKGKRGLSPYRGFQALGMPDAKARRLFLSQQPLSLNDDDFSRLPSLDSELLSVEQPKKIFYEKVVSRDPWPKNWSFRNIDYTTIASPWFRKRFDPYKVVLKKERLPRIALAIGGAERYNPNLEHPNYLRHEVFLRLSSAVKAKAINSHGLTLDPDIQDPIPATLFGLINNKLSKGSRGLFLVEGPYDCLHLLQHLYRPEIEGRFDTVGILGTPQWKNCLGQLQMHVFPDMVKRNIPLILAFDNDMAGEKLTDTAIEDLKSICYLSETKIKILDYPKHIKDPGDLPFDDFMESFEKLNL